MNLHMITHAVLCAVIATLIKKYLQLVFHLEDLEEKCLYVDGKHSSDSDSDSKMEEESERTNQHFSSFGTCHSSHKQNQVCHFKNLCYVPSEDVFIYFRNDSIQNFDIFDRNNLPLLSTPIGFNDNRFKLTYLKENVSAGFTVKWMHKISYIFSRFKPDNLMHVLHDDMIPLYFTLQNFEHLNLNTVLSTDKFDVQLLFMDDWPRGDYKDLYKLFTSTTPLYKGDLQKEVELVCFSRAIVGLLSDTLWYSYGFFEPQGPVVDPGVHAQSIKSTSQFILKNLNIQTPHFTSDFVTLISRKENRKILNENDLIQHISTEIGIKVVCISSETHTLTEMISLVAESTGIIGMHGSLMILSMFLKPGSFTIEMFPYGVPADHYTPYKTLSEIPDMDITYLSWENKNKEKTVGHVDYPSEHGGIMHLPPKQQAEILNQKTVPTHLCCDDPSWLYHIYQDTFVDSKAISELVKFAVDKGKAVKHLSNDKHNGIPSPLNNLQCYMKNDEKCSLHVQFQLPWNLKFLTYNKIQYEILVEQQGIDDSVIYIVEKPVLVISNGISCDLNYIIWARAVINSHFHGDYVHIKCSV